MRYILKWYIKGKEFAVYNFVRYDSTKFFTEVILALPVHRLVLVLLSYNPVFLKQEDVPGHSWSMSVAEMAGTAPCLENQSVDKANACLNNNHMCMLLPRSMFVITQLH